MKKNKIIFSWFLVLVWIVIIFFYSSKPANISDSESLSILSKVAQFLSTFHINIDTTNPIFNFIVRKIAHLTEYFILGFLFCNAIVYSYSNYSTKRILLYSFVFCLLYSISDEIHQIFVPGRACRLLDVFIDSVGFSIGIMLRCMFRKRPSPW